MSDKKIEDLKNDIQTMEKELAEAKKRRSSKRRDESTRL